jgi:ketosteroid isomerase-like protein
MQVEEKIALFERVVAAWNQGDLEGVIAEVTPDFEWDCTRSEIPGLSDVYRGREGYLEFAKTWRETLGETQLMLEEARELDDGRLYIGVYQRATGPQSGVDVELHYAQILEFDGGRVSRSELFGSVPEARAAVGLSG